MINKHLLNNVYNGNKVIKVYVLRFILHGFSSLKVNQDYLRKYN